MHSSLNSTWISNFKKLKLKYFIHFVKMLFSTFYHDISKLLYRSNKSNLYFSQSFYCLVLCHFYICCKCLLVAYFIKIKKSEIYFQYDKFFATVYSFGYQESYFYFTFVPVIIFFPYIRYLKKITRWQESCQTRHSQHRHHRMLRC